MKEDYKNISSLTMAEDNYKSVPYPKEKTIHQLFLEQVHKNPKRNALIYKGVGMTYQELNKKAARLAKRLLDCGLRQEDIVGVLLEPSFDLMVAIFGILKAGGAYMVIDTSYPETRIAYMLENCKVNCMIVQQKLSDSIQFQGTTIMIGEEDREMMLKRFMPTTAHSLAYVLFTSGTTGNPKAVMEEHRNVINVVYCLYEILGQDGIKDVIQFFSPSFTVSYQEMFTTLLFGGTYHIIESSVRNNIGKLFDYIVEKKISTVFFPTSYIKVIAKEERYYKRIIPSLKHIIAAGEKLMITEEFLHHLEENGTILYNNYGISEVNMATIYSVPYSQIDNDNLPIGKPAFNTYVYVLDENRIPVPIDNWGELYISGDSVCRGYYCNETMTSERFMEDVFHGGRMYKSGDVGKWDKNGYLVLQGRLDLQANIKGYRVETGEIEYHLMEYPPIKEVAAVVRHIADSDCIWAYIVTEQEISESELKKYLSSRVPEYMLPMHFVRLKELPKLPAGKVDRMMLAKNDLEDISNACKIALSDNDMFKRLSSIILQTLEDSLKYPLEMSTRLQDIGIDSLNFLRLVVSVEEAFEIEFDDDNLDLSRFVTVWDLMIYIEAKKEKSF